MNVIAQPDVFSNFRVKELRESDFWLGSAIPCMLKNPKCHIILFYSPVDTDEGIIDIWNSLAQSIAGPVICSVNVTARTEIMDAFISVSMDPDNPCNSYGINGVPTVLVFRNRFPQAFYNGPWSYNSLKKWIFVLSCKPGYKEPNQYYAGVNAIDEDITGKDYRERGFVYPNQSSEYDDMIGEYQQDFAGEEEGYEEEEGFEEEEEAKPKRVQRSRNVSFKSESQLSKK